MLTHLNFQAAYPRHVFFNDFICKRYHLTKKLHFHKRTLNLNTLKANIMGSVVFRYNSTITRPLTNVCTLHWTKHVQFSQMVCHLWVYTNGLHPQGFCLMWTCTRSKTDYAYRVSVLCVHINGFFSKLHPHGFCLMCSHILDQTLITLKGVCVLCVHIIGFFYKITSVGPI